MIRNRRVKGWTAEGDIRRFGEKIQVLLEGYMHQLRIPNNTEKSRSSTTISQGQSTVIYTPVLSVSLTKRTRSLLQKCVFTKQDN